MSPSKHCVWLICAAAGSGALGRSALAQQKIVKWDIQATVIEVHDPGGLFPSVQLGDPVHGWMSFNRGNDADPDLSQDHVGIYQNVVGFEGVSMVIDNPRGGDAARFVKDMRFGSNYSGTVENIGNDYVDPNDGVVDWVWVDTTVVPPAGSLSNFADLAVFLYGQGNVLPDLSLPAQLNLDDWPQAIIEFRDNFIHQDPTEIFAEIYSLTPVLVMPGDYDSNGVVDVNDYDLWRRGFGADSPYLPGVRDGDGNGDGFVDAADYVIWRKNVRQSAGNSSIENGGVPEPSKSVLLILAAVLEGCIRRRVAQ